MLRLPTNEELAANPRVLLTGSQAFGTASEDSDTDWFMSLDEFHAMGDLWRVLELQDGYIEQPYSVYKDIGGMRDFIVYDHHNYCNFARDDWLHAHDHCMAEKPSSKSRRIEIFRAYLYDELFRHPFAIASPQDIENETNERLLTHGNEY